MRRTLRHAHKRDEHAPCTVLILKLTFLLQKYELAVQHAGGAITILRPGDTNDVLYAGGVDRVVLRPLGATAPISSAFDPATCWYGARTPHSQREVADRNWQVRWVYDEAAV